MDKILEKFGKDKIEKVVKESNSFVDVTKKLGIDINKKYNVERSIKRLEISTEHFDSVKRVKEYKKRYKEEKLKELINNGKNFKEILLELDILPINSNYKTLKKYLKLFKINYNHLENKRNFIKIQWQRENLEFIIKKSNSLNEVLEKIGLRAAGNNFKTLKKYIELYDIDTSHFIKNYYKINILNKNKKINLEKILIEESSYNRRDLKRRLYEEGLKERKCELCGQGEEWMGKHMSLIIDHINGINNDNRIENLRIVCPNCNATLETHCRGNLKIKRKKEKEKEKETNILNSFIKRRKVERPSFEELIREIEKSSLESVGRKYGVTGNSIKKWVKTYQKYNI